MRAVTILVSRCGAMRGFCCGSVFDFEVKAWRGHAVIETTGSCPSCTALILRSVREAA